MTTETAIIPSNESLRFRNTSFPGCPLLLVHGKLEPAPSLWLFWIYRNRSPKTAEAYAKSIDLWYRALISSSLDWWEVTPSDLEAFQTLLAQSGSSTDTIRLRSIAISQFYRWCHENGLIARIPFVVRGVRSSKGAKSKTETVVGLPRTQRRSVQSHSVEQFDKILNGIERKSSGLLRRDELICEAARYLGLRRSEVAGLTVEQFLRLDPNDLVQPIVLRPETTKGRKERAVLAPRMFVQKVLNYIAGYRAEMVEEFKIRNPNYKDPGILFINERGKNAGMGVDPDYITRTWKEASKAAGVSSRFHNNRASFATSAADRAISEGEVPLALVKSLLGHSREETTQRYVDQANLKNQLLVQAKIVNDYYDAEDEA